METETISKKSKFLRYYLIISIILSFLAILFHYRGNIIVLFSPQLIPFISFLFGIILLSFFLYTLVNIYLIFKFVREKLNLLTLIIPGIDILTTILGFIIKKWANPFVIYFSYLSIPLEIFIILFAIYLLKRFK